MRFIHSNARLTPNYRRVKAPQQNTFRIIGGVHRGRRFVFPDDEAIRPSPDRVRETVFNWLQPLIPGARCLDLFAGSGALGLEALSRGAAHVEFVDRTARVTAAICNHLGTLREEAKARVHTADVPAFLRVPPGEAFDLVFLDPPYAGAAELLVSAATALEAHGWLAPGARIYLECAAKSGLPPLPANWEILRNRRAGQVAYHLAGRN
ncbi:MAG TPA: 16S rRNA (guanine(966)-N(2))-methyltransferase RsmD [Gammaproteobacteria bacterium]